jgi:hypothetical protein
MDMLIAIPSRGRSGNLARSTLRSIPEVFFPQTKMFVIGEELEKYKRAVFNCQYDGIELIPLEYSNMAQKRRMMGEWARDNGYSKFVMIDDDFTQFHTRIKDDPNLYLRKSNETVAQYLEFYNHVGVSPRFHNNAFDGEDPIVVENKRICGFSAFKVDVFLSCAHERVSTSEDMDVALQLLLKGYKNAVLHKWSWDQQVTGTAGGCSIYRTVELHNENIRKIHEMYPNFTRLREKNNVSAEAIRRGLASRLEVAIYWEKAYEHGAANAAVV